MGIPYCDQGGGGGETLYFHTYIGLDHFGGFKILNLIIQTNEYFWGYEDFVYIFGG